jgi:hypothetical protein
VSKLPQEHATIAAIFGSLYLLAVTSSAPLLAAELLKYDPVSGLQQTST